MTTVIIPHKDRYDLLQDCLDSLLAAEGKPRIVVGVNEETTETITRLARDYPAVETYHGGERGDFWPAINAVLESVPDDEPFCYFGKDVLFDAEWLVEAEKAFPANGLALLTFRDDMADGGNADHGMTTKNWLYVVYGYRHFPAKYLHYYCDSEFSDRSRDLGRLIYCPESYVKHVYVQSGDLGIKWLVKKHDKLVKDGRDKVYDLATARARLKELER